MEHNREYVQLRVRRMRNADLERKPNKWIVGLRGSERARRVLDIACGLGYDSLAWAKAGKQPVAIDFNFDLVKQAAVLAAEQGVRIDFVVADATRLPFRAGSFDIGFSENLFEHVPRWQQIVLEARRVLNDGGAFFVRTVNRHCPKNPEINHFHFYPWFPEFLKRPILKWIMRRRPAWINYTKFPAVNWFTYRGLAKFFRRHGFEAYEVFDLVRPEQSNRKLLSVPLLLLKRFRPLRYLAYPLLSSVQVLAVKRAGAAAEAARRREARAGPGSSTLEAAVEREAV